MTIQERITALRQLMKEEKIDVYIVPSSDYHQSEYVGDYFKTREFITGFTGSAGTAVITQTEAGLWTDGRYFIQAEAELAGSGIVLYKMGNPNVPTIVEYIENNTPQNGVLGFDGRVVSMLRGIEFENICAAKNITIKSSYDLIDMIWENRPELSTHPAFELDLTYTGESTSSKLERIREEMCKKKVSVHLLITLDDIAWLLNMRGSDIAYTPVVLCYAAITMKSLHLFIDESKLSNEMKAKFAMQKVLLHAYDDIYNFVKTLSTKEVILFDPDRINYALFKSIPTNTKLIEEVNPSVMMKAIKNETEIKNIKNAHIKDGIAQTKFMYWLKHVADIESVTELSASDKLEELRAGQDSYLYPSFGPISAFGAHAAICHYSSSPTTNVNITKGSLFLMDTGGNYMDGSTDITRTYAIGSISDELKRDYTNVLRGNLALANARFIYGCSGKNLDILARQYLWNVNQDYNHGTGHGVGYLLSVHEASGRIIWRGTGEQDWPLEDGMIITNEPGLYVEGSHGIRLENELLVRRDINNDFGQFMRFEVITYAPFDLDAIDTSLLRDDEKESLNKYHQSVYDVISPHLTNEEKQWLKHSTRAI